MALGRQGDRQGDLMVTWSEMPRSPGHVFYDRLQRVLVAADFDAFAETLTGEWLGVQQKLGLDVNFWFGHQGYEYIDLGRFWQILLFVGLLLWLLLVGRALRDWGRKN